MPSEPRRKHARVIGSPGEWARFTGLVRAVLPLFPITLASGYLLRALLPVPDMSKPVVGLLFLSLAGVLAWFALFKGRRLGMYLKGAKGEEIVAQELAFLPADYTVLHGVNLEGRALLSRGDCDHVVIGPTGVFLVETKNWNCQITVAEGKVLCDGHEPPRQPLDQAKRLASELQRRFTQTLAAAPVVRPVVCFVGATMAGGSKGVSGVLVCAAESLLRIIEAPADEPLPEAIRQAAVRDLETLG